MGVFTELATALEEASRRSKESGKTWSVKELPVNAVLPDQACNFGFYSFPGSPIDNKYRARQLDVVAVRDVERMKRETENLREIMTPARL